MRKEHALLIGERTAEDVKLGIGSAWPVPDRPELETRTFTVRGREKVGGMPKTSELGAADVRAALDEPVEAIIAAVRTTLEECPPELSGDVMEHGITLTGGGALLPGIDLRMASATGIPVFVADTRWTAWRWAPAGAWRTWTRWAACWSPRRPERPDRT